MNKKTAAIAVALAVLIALVAIGIGSMRSGPPLEAPNAAAPSDDAPGAESAIPAMSESDEYLFVKLAHPGTLGARLSSLGEAMTDIAGDEDLSRLISRSFDLSMVPSAVELLGVLTDFVDGTEEIALLVKHLEKSVYLSFLANDEDFDKFISSPAGSTRRAELWTTDRGQGWRMSFGEQSMDILGDQIFFYALKKPFGKSNLVMLANSEEGLDSMISASGGDSFASRGVRHTLGEDYIQVRATPSVPGWMKWLAGRGPLVTEMAWTSSGKKTDIETYTDAYKGMETNFRGSGITSAPLPVLGDGNLAMFMMTDIPFLCYSLFPDRVDYVQAFLDLIDEYSRDGTAVPAALARDIKALLSECRVSVAVISDGDKEPNQAYALIESASAATLDRLFIMAQLLIKKPANIDGWDTAYSSSLGPKGSLVLARKANTVLVGVGDAAAYGRLANIPDGADVTGPYLSNVLVTSKMIDLYRALPGKAGSGLGGFDPTFFLDFLSGVDSIQTRQSEIGVGSITIYWKN
ncbi:MAG: hypothetical protein LBT31_07985 [Synergistaceae bacterium]|jgi:hypothetical protein|nr:hypothetical protein [Synergistaceae bacterium]